MNPDVKKLLVTALRSGDYQKIQGTLAKTKNDGTVGYCCLGVLHCLATDAGKTPHPLEFGKPAPYIDNDVWFVKGDNGEGDDGDDDNAWHTAFPPHSVNLWAGLSNDEAATLANINDTSVTFEPVIDYIEKNL